VFLVMVGSDAVRGGVQVSERRLWAANIIRLTPIRVARF
jgi:hypothetical protein